MKKASGLLLVLLCAALVGCAAGLTVDKVGDVSLDPNNKEIVLLTTTRYDAQIQKSLTKAGLVVKEQPATRIVQKKNRR